APGKWHGTRARPPSTGVPPPPPCWSGTCPVTIWNSLVRACQLYRCTCEPAPEGNATTVPAACRRVTRIPEIVDNSIHCVDKRLILGTSCPKSSTKCVRTVCFVSGFLDGFGECHRWHFCRQWMGGN